LLAARADEVGERVQAGLVAVCFVVESFDEAVERDGGDRPAHAGRWELDGAADRHAMFASGDVLGELGFVAEALAGGYAWWAGGEASAADRG
jgi:hypothetical protein